VQESLIYEIEQTDLILAYNCLSYFSNKSAFDLYEYLKKIKSNLENDRSEKEKSSLDFSENSKFKELKFLFFTTILTKLYLSYGNTFIYLNDIFGKNLVFKISEISNFFEEILSLLSDRCIDKNSNKEKNFNINKNTKIKSNTDFDLFSDIDYNEINFENYDFDKEKSIDLGEKQFLFKFDDMESVKRLIEDINKEKIIFEIINKDKINEKVESLEQNIIEEKVIKNPPLFIYEDYDKIYFRRFYLYELLIAKNIVNIGKTKDINNEKKGKELEFIKIFEDQLDKNQIEAIKSAIENRLTIISGGPGTGKTYIISLIILAYIYLYGYKSEDIIAVAPTGKAAKRISESIQNNIYSFICKINALDNKVDIIDDIKNNNKTENQKIKDKDIKVNAITIHRLLKGSEFSPSFLHNRENKLDYKLIIVDEASMIDIPLMAKLLDAIKEDTNIILSGDANQLSSVEAGRVFSDLKDFFLLDIKNKLNANIVELTKSYRYKAKSIIEESKEILYKILNSKNDEENKKQAECFVELMSKKERLIETEINNNLFDRIKKNFEEYNIKDFGLVISNIEADDRIKKQFELLRKFKFLSPLRLSKYGTFNINKSFANYLKKIKEKQFIPIIITKNNYQLNLFNGDIGIVEEENDEAYAYFENEEKDEPTRKFNLSSLSNWEPAYCLSVHKSQGSEFDIVVLFLPENIDRFEFITLELLYTAITRAKEDFYIVSAKHSLEKVLLKRTKRFTGLFTKLQTMI